MSIPDPATLTAMTKDITTWTRQLVDAIDTRTSGLHAARTETTGRPTTNAPVETAAALRATYAERLAPIANLAHEWATIRSETIPHGAELAYLHAHIPWASRRPGYDTAADIIIETHAWIATETGNGPETTDFSCPHCLVRGKRYGGADVKLLRYPTSRGYSTIMVCPRCSAMHTTESLKTAWAHALAENDIAMPAEWIRTHWNIKPATWRKWKQRGKITAGPDGNYPLNEVRHLAETNRNRA